MSTPKAGRTVVVSEGEIGGLPVAVRSILAPLIMAWRQTLGVSAAGIEEVEAGLSKFTFEAAEAIAPAYVALGRGKLAGCCPARGVDAVAWNCAGWNVLPIDLATFLLVSGVSTSEFALEAASTAAACSAEIIGMSESDLFSVISVRTNEG